MDAGGRRMMNRCFFGTQHRPYYIVAPDYRHTSAGIRVMHQLCHGLNEIGASAHITGCTTLNARLRTPPLTTAVINGHANAGLDPIAVYPEIIAGNPLNCRRVVRYILNTPGHIGGPDTFDPGEILYAYDPYFVPAGMKAKILTVPCTDDRIMHNRDNPDDGNRQGAFFYAMKYRHFGNEIDDGLHPGATDLSDRVRSVEEIAAILRKAAVLYCYEPSGITIDAILCGCPVVYVLTDYMPQRPAQIFFGEHGACTARPGQPPDPDKLRIARNSLIYCPHEYRRKIAQQWIALEHFFDDTQK